MVKIVETSKTGRKTETEATGNVDDRMAQIRELHELIERNLRRDEPTSDKPKSL